MKRLECLDGLRGLLAVYVLLGHMAPFAVLPQLVQAALSHGGAAVDVFFVLSGLVITQSLLHLDGRAKPFLIARAARIFPVFLPVFALAVAVSPWSCGFEHLPWIGSGDAARNICVMAWPRTWLPEIMAHLTMTHGLFPNAVLPDVWVSFLGSAWSLSTEWQFYLAALVAVGGCQRAWRRRSTTSDDTLKHFQADWKSQPAPACCFGNRLYQPDGSSQADVAPGVPIDPPQVVCWMLLGLAVAGVAWHLSMPETSQFSRAFLPNKAHFFALGVASVALVRRESGALWRYGLVLAASLMICATQGAIDKMLPPLVWTACLGVQVLPEQAGPNPLGRLLRSSVAQYLGAISYCLYLVNEPIHKMTVGFLSNVADGNAMLFSALWIPAAIGLPILASMWLHNHIEIPAQRWGRSIATSAPANLVKQSAV